MTRQVAPPRLQLSGKTSFLRKGAETSLIKRREGLRAEPLEVGMRLYPRMNWSSVKAAFVLTPETKCPYLPNRWEQKLVSSLEFSQLSLTGLNLAGFRRSHFLTYRPVCRDCNACKTVRLVCADMCMTRSQKRLFSKLKQVEDVSPKIRDQNQAKGLQRKVCPAVASSEHFVLFAAYIKARHKDGEMAGMGLPDFREMVEEASPGTFLVEWRTSDAMASPSLVAACLVDVLEDGLSMVYSYFDPDYTVKGLGTFMILDLAHFCVEKRLPYLYLGYWVENSEKMAYKTRFKPLEVHDRQGWREIDQFSSR